MNSIPPSFKPVSGEWLIIPLQHIFGSEELSLYTPSVAERMPKPYIAIGKKDAERLMVEEDDQLHLKIGLSSYDFPVRVKQELVEGLAAIPHIPGLTDIIWPAKGSLIKLEL